MPDAGQTSVNKLFDYIFYRTYVFYLNRHDNTPVTYGSIVVSLVQTFCIIDTAIVIQWFVPFETPSKIYWGILMVLALVYNWFKYERNPYLDEMKARWDNEPEKERSEHGTLLVIALVSLVLFPIIMGVLRHNLGYLKEPQSHLQSVRFGKPFGTAVQQTGVTNAAIRGGNGVVKLVTAFPTKLK